jgi:hypothetical protein
VIVLAGRDITDILKKSGLDTPAGLRRYLRDNYPPLPRPLGLSIR